MLKSWENQSLLMKKAILLVAVLLLGTLETNVELGVGQRVSLGNYAVELVDLSGSTAAFAFFEGNEKISGFEVVETGDTIRVRGFYLTLEGVAGGKATVKLSDQAPAGVFREEEALEFFEEHYSEYGKPLVTEARFNRRDAVVVYAHAEETLPAVNASINGEPIELPATTIVRAAATFFDAKTGEVLAEYAVN
ncbi:hypothetical protein COX85_00605 [Candidatus Micrarchaeota archaeon CG_4_10_14_0_2_um_filter_55_9]|nr:MAG: hypothetical protein COX85_00605 [Candidatus Micrarchaeota archaeon CG_4_10_14_0_2_um_filter_55_9]